MLATWVLAGPICATLRRYADHLEPGASRQAKHLFVGVHAAPLELRIANEPDHATITFEPQRGRTQRALDLNVPSPMRARSLQVSTRTDLVSRESLCVDPEPRVTELVVMKVVVGPAVGRRSENEAKTIARMERVIKLARVAHLEHGVVTLARRVPMKLAPPLNQLEPFALKELGREPFSDPLLHFTTRRIRLSSRELHHDRAEHDLERAAIARVADRVDLFAQARELFEHMDVPPLRLITRDRGAGGHTCFNALGGSDRQALQRSLEALTLLGATDAGLDLGDPQRERVKIDARAGATRGSGRDQHRSASAKRIEHPVTAT